MSTNSINVYNTSNLSGSHFEFNVIGYDNLNFNIQTANLPSIQVNPKEVPTPVGATHVAGDKVQYETLELSFIVDESLNDWRECYNWMRALAPTHLDSTLYNQYTNYDKDLYTSATLFILTNSLHVNVKCTFHNLFPISLTGLDFSTKDVEDRKLFSTVTFAYDYYDLEVNPIYNDKYILSNVIN